VISADKIIIALDTQDETKARDLLTSLAGEQVWIKVGMEAFYSFGPEIVRTADNLGFKVFLDLKLHDIPNTVAQSIKSLARLPIKMLNVHAAGGEEMMRRSFDMLRELPSRPLLIAVTQLTSTSEVQMQREQKISASLEESVLSYATLAKKSGLDGVVSSPLEVPLIKKELGKTFITITPGIRPPGANSDDQQRITTPKDAINLGTDFMVIGRPITGQQNPKLALQTILQG
jgi:orotidine-5'-phosphate decarboxylase